MADNFIHDRPGRAQQGRSKRRRHVEQQPMLELPLPQHKQEAEAQPAAPEERGVAEIDFYV